MGGFSPFQRQERLRLSWEVDSGSGSSGRFKLHQTQDRHLKKSQKQNKSWSVKRPRNAKMTRDVSHLPAHPPASKGGCITPLCCLLVRRCPEWRHIGGRDAVRYLCEPGGEGGSRSKRFIVVIRQRVTESQRAPQRNVGRHGGSSRRWRHEGERAQAQGGGGCGWGRAAPLSGGGQRCAQLLRGELILFAVPCFFEWRATETRVLRTGEASDLFVSS